MIVAKLEHDHLEDKPRDKDFELEALSNWWGWVGADEVPTEVELENFTKVKFRLYDDDNELYFSGWLINDDRAIVQSFVLGWAQVDSGCTIIKVKDIDGWQQQIG